MTGATRVSARTVSTRTSGTSLRTAWATRTMTTTRRRMTACGSISTRVPGAWRAPSAPCSPAAAAEIRYATLMVCSHGRSPGPGPRHTQMGCMVLRRTFHTAPEQGQGRMGLHTPFSGPKTGSGGMYQLYCSGFQESNHCPRHSQCEWFLHNIGPDPSLCPGTGHSQCDYTVRPVHL